MRIALLAPIAERVPPPAYGGIELVVALLADGLTEAGHEVTLFATADAATKARLAAVQDRPLRSLGLAAFEEEPRQHHHAFACFARAGEFDVIHNHLGTLGVLLAAFVSTPVITTLHGAFTAHNAPFYAARRDHAYVSISRAQRRSGPDLAYAGMVYNGIRTEGFAPARKRGYLLHLARLCAEKGTHLAIDVAVRAGRPIVLAGKVDPFDRAYFQDHVAPRIDGRRVSFVGEVGGQAKADLLAGADALLHPVTWPEPFGLAMVEAMASGTPVLAFPIGSIPEVVEQGVTGFVVGSVEEMAGAVPLCAQLDPGAIRARAVARFDARRMVEGYEALYRALVEPPRVSITLAPEGAGPPSSEGGGVGPARGGITPA